MSIAIKTPFRWQKSFFTGDAIRGIHEIENSLTGFFNFRNSISINQSYIRNKTDFWRKKRGKRKKKERKKERKKENKKERKTERNKERRNKEVQKERKKEVWKERKKERSMERKKERKKKV